jgi:hypothetical protein
VTSWERQSDRERQANQLARKGKTGQSSMAVSGRKQSCCMSPARIGLDDR